MSVVPGALDGSAWQPLLQDDTLTRWDWLHDNRPNYQETENLSGLALECWRFGETPEDKIFRISDLSNGIEKWLDEVPPTGKSGVQPQGGLRIIYSAQPDASQIPYTKAQFAKINHAFRLPHIETQDWSGSCGFCTVLEEEGTRSEMCP